MSIIEDIISNMLNHIHPEVKVATYIEREVGSKKPIKTADFFRMVYVISGESTFKDGEDSHTSKSGNLYLIPPGAEYSYTVTGEQALHCYICNFYSQLGTVQYSNLLDLPYKVAVNNDDEAVVQELFVKMINAHRSSLLTKNLRQRAALMELLARFLEHCSPLEPSTSLSEENQLNEVLFYIEENLHTTIQVEELAKIAFLHPNYFITSFTNMVGSSPIQYVTERRLEKARRLLTATNDSIASVAARVGMQSHYLSRMFKRYTGLTPMSYRKLAGSSYNVDN